MPYDSGLARLSRDECLGLLATASFARVGVSVEALPAILPVMIATIDETVIFRTVPGTKLAYAATGPILAVEADEYDADVGDGWSVLVRGVATELEDPERHHTGSGAPPRLLDRRRKRGALRQRQLRPRDRPSPPSPDPPAGAGTGTIEGGAMTSTATITKAVSSPLLLDSFIDAADARVAAHLIVDASPDVTFSAARSLDLLEVQTPLLTASFWVRGLPAKLLHRAEPPPPEQLTIGEDMKLPGWLFLDEAPGREIVFGAVGVFWTPTIVWNPNVGPRDFAAFMEPGWGKIACSYSVRPYGEHRTLFTYECRTLTTDDDSRRKFNRYWWLIRPFVQHIMDATARTIGAHAESTATEHRAYL